MFCCKGQANRKREGEGERGETEREGRAREPPVMLGAFSHAPAAPMAVTLLEDQPLYSLSLGSSVESPLCMF